MEATFTTKRIDTGKIPLVEVKRDKGYKDMCVPLAIHFATGKPLEEVFVDLAHFMYTTGKDYKNEGCWGEYIHSLGYRNIVKSENSLAYNKTIANVVELGFKNCIVGVRGHLLAVVDGCVTDTWDSRNKRSITVWVHIDELKKILMNVEGEAECTD